MLPGDPCRPALAYDAPGFRCSAGSRSLAPWPGRTLPGGFAAALHSPHALRVGPPSLWASFAASSDLHHDWPEMAGAILSCLRCRQQPLRTHVARRVRSRSPAARPPPFGPRIIGQPRCKARWHRGRSISAAPTCAAGRRCAACWARPSSY